MGKKKKRIERLEAQVAELMEFKKWAEMQLQSKSVALDESSRLDTVDGEPEELDYFQMVDIVINEMVATKTRGNANQLKRYLYSYSSFAEAQVTRKWWILRYADGVGEVTYEHFMKIMKEKGFI